MGRRTRDSMNWRTRPAMALAAVLACAGAAAAGVSVIVGPTPIVAGNARAAGDITVVNEHLAFALAVQSAVPYGVPRAALIDLAPVSGGTIGRDRVVFADFVPNHWSAWPNDHQQIEILERGPARVVIRTTRDWGKVAVITRYSLAADADHLDLQVTMRNDGDVALPGLLSGLTLWPSSGYLFSVPGMNGVAEGKADGALADRVVAYDEDWAIALHAPYFDHVGDDSMDLYRLHTLEPGASHSFEGWLQVRPSGDLAPIVRAEIERRGLPSGRVHGVVAARGGERRGGHPIDHPVVVVERGGKPYAWVMGGVDGYDLTLPRGDYVLYATAKNHSLSRRVRVTVAAHSSQVRNFRSLAGPGRVRFHITETRTGLPLDARLVMAEGPRSPVEFLGRGTFFTELDRKGQLDLPIAPGRYVFTVSSGGGFLGPTRPVGVDVLSGGTQDVDVTLTREFDPTRRGWYGADLHHHADQAEAVTPPADLARSQLAAGLDLLFVSDHDSTVNHRALQMIADRRGLPFIAGVELSPSWGHFNAYPLLSGQELRVDTGVAGVEEIFREARRQGAMIVQVNHPFIPYGYLTSVAAGVAPGGFNPGFDLLEINQAAPADDGKVLQTLRGYWDRGIRRYLSAGTDVHDVWKGESGRVRAVAHVDGPVSAEGFAAALKAGHAYVTRGPLIYPSAMFGDELRVETGKPFTLSFDLESVNGLRRVDLVGGGGVWNRRLLRGAPHEARVGFSLSGRPSAWYALVVEDVRGLTAYTDPIWIDVAPQQSGLAVPGL